jgi:hypothetical protein
MNYCRSNISSDLCLSCNTLSSSSSAAAAAAAVVVVVVVVVLWKSKHGRWAGLVALGR